MNHWVIVYRVAWGAAILLLIIVAMTFFIPKNKALQDYQKRRGLLQQENRQTEAVVNDLKERQDRFNTDPAFVERTAREAGMVKKDEIVFKFTNAAPRSKPPAMPRSEASR